jgi:hypothetical protein
MARWRVWLKCIAQAVVNKGLKGLVGLVPFGESLYDVAADAVERINKEQQREEERRQALQDLVQTPALEVQRQAEAVAREVAAGQPAAVQQQLATYLTQMPAVIRASLRRTEGPDRQDCFRHPGAEPAGGPAATATGAAAAVQAGRPTGGRRRLGAGAITRCGRLW